MITFPRLAPDSIVFPIIDRWIDAVAASNSAAAAEFLHNSEDWPLDRIESAIAPIAPDTTFEPWASSAFAITRASDAHIADRLDVPELNEPAPLMSFWMLDANPQLAVDFPNCIGDVLYPIPINGYWSDISASFHLREVSANSVALLLSDFLAIRDE